MFYQSPDTKENYYQGFGNIDFGAFDYGDTEFVKEKLKSKIPFLFSGMPFNMIDNGVITELDGNACKVFQTISRYIDLRDMTQVGDRIILSGWTIAVSEEKIAETTGLSQRTVIRKIELLEENGVLEVDRQKGKCNRYRIQAYARGIQKVEEDKRRQQEIDKQNSDSSQNDTRSGSQQRHSDRPVTHVSPPAEQPVTHVSDVKEFNNLKEISLSSNSKEKKENSTKDESADKDVSAESLSTQQLIKENPDWQEYEKYAKAFYGEIHSKKFLVEACVYFKEKVAEVGKAEDGVDRVMQMIESVKKAGAYHHTSFDKQFGVEAYNKVLKDEKRRLSGTDTVQDDGHMAETKKKKKGKLNNQHRSEIDKVLRQNNIDSAKELVEKVLSYRWHMSQSFKHHYFYTEEQVEELWRRAYIKFDSPENREEWLNDRIYVREKLSSAGIYKSLSFEDLNKLREESIKKFGEDRNEKEEVEDNQQSDASEKDKVEDEQTEAPEQKPDSNKREDKEEVEDREDASKDKIAEGNLKAEDESKEDDEIENREPSEDKQFDKPKYSKQTVLDLTVEEDEQAPKERKQTAEFEVKDKSESEKQEKPTDESDKKQEEEYSNETKEGDKDSKDCKTEETSNHSESESKNRNQDMKDSDNSAEKDEQNNEHPNGSSDMSARAQPWSDRFSSRKKKRKDEVEKKPREPG